VTSALERERIGQQQERVAGPVDARDAREAIVDGRAQRPDRDLDNLRDAKLAVLLQ